MANETGVIYRLELELAGSGAAKRSFAKPNYGQAVIHKKTRGTVTGQNSQNSPPGERILIKTLPGLSLRKISVIDI